MGDICSWRVCVCLGVSVGGCVRVWECMIRRGWVIYSADSCACVCRVRGLCGWFFSKYWHTWARLGKCWQVNQKLNMFCNFLLQSIS